MANRIQGPGIDVPKATNVVAVTESFIPTVQPKWLARSPSSAVNIPMHAMDTTKHRIPPHRAVGYIHYLY